MAGIRITDLPVVSEVLPSDQILVARGETTRKALGTALVTKEDVRELYTLVDQLTSETLTPVNSDETAVSLYYDGLTKRLSADITGIIPQDLGGTGFQAYTYRQALIGAAQGNRLIKLELSAGRGIDFNDNLAYFSIFNTEPHIPTHLSASYLPNVIDLFSSTGTDTTLSAASRVLAGVMSSQDKTNLDDFVIVNTTTPLIFTSSLTATNQNLSASKVAIIDSPNNVTITLNSTANPGTVFTFVRAGSGNVEFVSQNQSVVINCLNNPTYREISHINGQAIAVFKETNQWHLVGDLMSVWDNQLSGPDSISDEQKVGIYTLGALDTIYFESDWNKTSTTFESMTVQVNGVARAVVDFTSDRLGKPFGYKLGPSLGGATKNIESGPQYIGTFASGTVNLV